MDSPWMSIEFISDLEPKCSVFKKCPWNPWSLSMEFTEFVHGLSPLLVTYDTSVHKFEKSMDSPWNVKICYNCSYGLI